MDPESLRALLARIQNDETTVEAALAELRQFPFRQIEGATIDHHRALRQGCPEVIYAESKTATQVVTIVDALLDGGHKVLVTRLDPDKAAILQKAHPETRYATAARTARIEVKPTPLRECAPVAVVCAGTSDLPVAEEASETLAALGLPHTRIDDVGVAGLHRLLDQVDTLQKASAAIVIAGMEGALPSVVGGLIACPVIAVPTSVGYGTALGGLTALFGMLTSCAAGVVVVNIDNGFGAAMAIHRMLLNPEP